MTSKEKKPNGRRRNGEGSIYQRASDGLWVGSAYVITTSGERKRKPVYGHSFDEVREKLVKLQERSLAGIPIPERSCTLGAYLDYWLTEVVGDKALTTQRGYESAVRLHIKPILGKKRIDRLGVQDVRHLIAVLRAKCLCCANKWDRSKADDDKCCSVGKCCRHTPSTRQIQYVHAQLRNALNSAMRDELITRNVAELVNVPAPKYKVGKGLSITAVKSILDVVKDHRFYIAYLLAATMGLRRSELLGLRWSDVDLDKGVLEVGQTVHRVTGKLLLKDSGKSDHSEEAVPIPTITLRALRKHKIAQAAERLATGPFWTDHDLVCPTSVGTPVEPRSFNRHAEQVSTQLGIEFTPHDLRHTMVTLLLEWGTPPHIVQAIARHAGIEVTMKVYAHANLDAMREAVNKFDQRFT